MKVSEKKTPHGLLVVVTDSSILGKKFEEGKLQLDLSKEFYKGEEKDVEEIKDIILSSRHVHLTGEESVDLGISLGLIEKDRVIWISGVPHAEIVLDG